MSIVWPSVKAAAFAIGGLVLFACSSVQPNMTNGQPANANGTPPVQSRKDRLKPPGTVSGIPSLIDPFRNPKRSDPQAKDILVKVTNAAQNLTSLSGRVKVTTRDLQIDRETPTKVSFVAIIPKDKSQYKAHVKYVELAQSVWISADDIIIYQPNLGQAFKKSLDAESNRLGRQLKMVAGADDSDAGESLRVSRATKLGTETLSGRKTVVLSLQLNRGEFRKVQMWVDTKTWLPAKVFVESSLQTITIEVLDLEINESIDAAAVTPDLPADVRWPDS